MRARNPLAVGKIVMLIPRDYWEHHWSDLLAGLVACWRRQPPPAEVELPGVGSCLQTLSGRAALVAALRALSLPPKARIGVPLFCCPVVFSAVRSAGCQPVFVDVNPETFCLCPRDLAAKVESLDAVVAVHMFGNLCDVPAIRQLVGSRPVIEDCAQALGSRWGGHAAGTLGTVAFFSFRAGKYISAGWGGAVFTRERTLWERLRDLIRAQPPPPLPATRHALTQYIKSVLRTPPAYGWVGRWLWTAANRRNKRKADAPISPRAIYPGDSVIISRRLRELNSVVERQRAYAARLTQGLCLEGARLCPEPAGIFANRYLFPLILRSAEERDRLADGLLAEGVDTMRYLDDVVRVARESYGYKGGCPVSERLSRTVLILPAYHALRESDLRRVQEATNRVWARIRSAHPATPGARTAAPVPT